MSETLLKLVHYSELTQWDIKPHFSATLESCFPLEVIGKHTIQITHKTKLNMNPDKEYKILGISNEDGMVDAYLEYGKNINQPYIYVDNGYLAYNPYRINVGSIGIKTADLKNEYISPAYVVIKCKETILPEYLYLVLKSFRFRSIIRDNTTGSVRQTLSYNKLANIKIPVPSSIKEQQDIVTDYKSNYKLSLEAKMQVEEMNLGVSEYLTNILGITEKKRIKKEGLFTVRFSEIDKWGVSFLTSSHVIYNKKYPTIPIREICKTGSGGTPSRTDNIYFNGDIPWVKTGEVKDDIIYDTEEKITRKALQNSSAKLYPKDSIVVAMYGQGLTRGRTAKLGIEASTNQACLVLYDIDNSVVLTDYLWFFLQGEYRRLRDLAYGNNQPNLNASIIKNYPVVIPPLYSDDKNEITQTTIVKEIRRRKEIIQSIAKKAQAFEHMAQSRFEEVVFGET